jgi:hypothetical protein
MRIRIVVLAGMVALPAACGADPVEPPPSPPSTPSATPSVTIEPSPLPSLTPSPSPEPSLGMMPATFGPDLEPAEVPPTELIPEGADPTGVWFGFAQDGVRIVVTWMEPGSDPTRVARGFAVWRRAEDAPHWRRDLARRHPAKARVTAIDVFTTDVTGDGSDDALVFEGTGGSGACGTWLVVDLLSAERIYLREELCDGRIEPGPPGSPGLVLTESVFRPGDAHCCPSAMRRTTLSWTGSGWRVTDRELVEA